MMIGLRLQRPVEMYYVMLYYIILHYIILQYIYIYIHTHYTHIYRRLYSPQLPEMLVADLGRGFESLQVELVDHSVV